LLNDPSVSANVLLPEEAVQLMPRRSTQAHKYDCGRVLVIAGSRSMTGAALLSGSAALAGGAGMVYIATPSSAAMLLHGRVPELIIRPQADTPAGNLSEAAVEELLATARQSQAVAIGPGLGPEETTKRAVAKLLNQIPAPVVADADALNALSQARDALKGARGPRILTPHSGEMARLLATTPEAVEENRLQSAQKCAEEYGAIVVLKGARTVVAEPATEKTGPDGRQFVIPTGNAGLATAGTGDVLTGLIAALLAQGLPPLSSALLGAYVHGLAGDLGRDAKTELSLTASDVTEHLPKAFQKLTGGGPREARTA
jgi:NAD(P)H-hydrate epimerase